MAVISLFPLLLLTGQFVVLAIAGAPYILPGNSAYPSEEVWSQFNSTLGGKLIKTHPYGAPCYSATYDAEQCLYLAQNKGNLTFRDTLPAGLMYTNWEQTWDLEGCPVPDLPSDGSAPLAINATCTLGAMSNYVVNATGVDDIVAAVKFAAQYNLRFRIKNSGHDYTGRSSGEGSLSVWTRQLNDAELVANFVPECTNAKPQPVISAGPAVNVEELYQFGSANGVDTIGGFTQTVGATGGYILGGGTGPLGPIYGLGVDNVVQYEVVMANGSQQIANEVLNPDLFWALRGGGGAFAVTTRVYIRTYPAFSTVNTVSGEVVCQNANAFRDLVGAMVDLQIPIREAKQTGIWEADASTYSLALASFAPFTSDGETPAESLAVYNSIKNISGCMPEIAAAQFIGSGSWYAAYLNILPLINAGGSVGVNLADNSRMISYNAINDPAQREKIKEFITSSPVPTIIQNAVGGVTSEVAPNATAVHPSWRSAFSFMDSPAFGPWQGISAAQNATVLALNSTLTKTFGTAVYYNEQYPIDPDWQAAQFGSNYPRLLSIKKQVDPDGVFSCRNCVGSETGY